MSSLNRLENLRPLGRGDRQEYQACEHREWEQSEAAQFIHALQAKMIRVIAMDNDSWEITDPNVFLQVEAERRVNRGIEV